MFRRITTVVVTSLAVAGSLSLATSTTASAAASCGNRALFNVSSAVHTELPVVSSSNHSTTCEMGVGNQGEGVIGLQLALNSSCHHAGLTVDGVFGNATRAALKTAQAAGGLTGSQVDGVYGPVTRTHISWPSYNSSGRFAGCVTVG